ncbi:MAG: HEPN domain-containing protein [Muricoprocola sp.]
MEREEILWLEFAKTDLGVAKHLDECYYPKPLEIICYHCQQAAEKAIKAIIISCGAQGGMPKKHNLSFLLEQLKNMVDIPEKYYDYSDALTPYGIAVRYPSELYIEEHHVQDALGYASEILEWAENVIYNIGNAV